MRERSDLLIVRNDRLGDTILALPVITALQALDPQMTIHFWCSPAVEPLIRCVQGVAEIIVSTDQESQSVIQTLKSLPLKSALCLRATSSNAVGLFKAGIPIRVGTNRRLYSLFFNRRYRVARRDSGKHETELNLELCSQYYGQLEAQPPFPALNVPTAAQDRVSARLQVAKIRSKKFNIVLHPGSGGSARDWPAPHFRALAGLLSRQIEANIIVTGSEGERELAALVAGSEHLNLAGETDLLELTALFSRADLVVSNSTGPLHLANLAGAKVLGLYPPVKNCLPDRWGPYGHLDSTLVPDLPLCNTCQPGDLSSCRCMDSLTPDRVVGKCLELLNV